MKKLISTILILAMLLPCAVFAAPEDTTEPAVSAPTLEDTQKLLQDYSFDIKSKAALLIDMTTGRVVFEKNANEKFSPAGVSAMMTGIISLENLDLTEYIDVKEDVIKDVSGGQVDLQPGESISAGIFDNLLLLSSGNDVGYVLADRIAGSIPEFVEMMNDKAEILGCTNTHFTNPSGIYDSDEYTTCVDLAKIAQYCMLNETFAKIVAKSSVSVAETLQHPARYIANSNLLVYDETNASRVYVNNVLRFCKYDGCIGIRAGYTAQSGATLVAAAQRQGTTYLVVLLGSTASDRFADAIALFDYGFDKYKTLRVDDIDFNVGEIAVKGGTVDTAPLSVEVAKYLTVPTEIDSYQLSTSVRLDEYIAAPASAGVKVGVLDVVAGGETVGTYDITLATDLEQGGFFSRLELSEKPIGKILLSILAVIVGLVLLVLLFVLIDRRRTAKRKAARALKRQQENEKEDLLRSQWEASRRK